MIKGGKDLTYNQAMDIVAKHQTRWPVNMIEMAKDLGLTVFKVEGWPRSLSGKIELDERGGESGFAIFVNADHPEERRDFTIAHEVAHFILHRHLVGDGIIEDGLYRSGLSNKVEGEANRLATDILMPWHLVESAFNAGHTTIPALATALHVSESAMSIRMGVPHEGSTAPDPDYVAGADPGEVQAQV